MTTSSFVRRPEETRARDWRVHREWVSSSSSSSSVNHVVITSAGRLVGTEKTYLTNVTNVPDNVPRIAIRPSGVEIYLPPPSERADRAPPFCPARTDPFIFSDRDSSTSSSCIERGWDGTRDKNVIPSGKSVKSVICTVTYECTN